MKAIILAGGKGTRLLPYTTIFPKPLVPVGQRPILDIVIRQLAHYGFNDIVLSVGHLAELIQAYLLSKQEEYASVQLSYVREDAPLGTAGPVGLISNLNGMPFLVMNGDILTTLSYADMMAFHKRHGGLLTVGVYEKRMQLALGEIATDHTGQVLDYLEKPEKIFSVSIGVNIYSPEVLQYVEPEAYLDFPTLVRRLLDNGERVMSYPFKGHWLDIGNHEDYRRAQEEFELYKDQFLPMEYERNS